MDFPRHLPFLPAQLLPAVFITLAGLLLPASGAFAQERPADPADEARIASEVSREGEVFLVRVRADIAVSRALAWAVLTDYERYSEFIPEIDSSRIVSRAGSGVVLDQKGRMSFLFFSQPVDVRLAVVETPPAQVASRALAGNLREFSGRYVITETPGGVRIEHNARFVPEFDLPPLLGPIIVRSVLERNFTAVLREMQRRAALGAPAGVASTPGQAVSSPPGRVVSTPAPN